MKLKGRIFFLVFILILVCGGCTEKASKEPPQIIEETEDTPADIYEFQEEEE